MKEQTNGTTKRKSRKKDTSPFVVEKIIAPDVSKESKFQWRGPEKRDGSIYLSREDLLFVGLTEAKAINALQAVSIHKSFLKAQAERHEQERHAAELEMARLTADAARLEQLNKRMWADVGQAYKIDFSQATYDDETGRITLLEELTKKETQDG